MRRRVCRAKFWGIPIVLGVLTAGSLIVGPPAASAADDGPTLTGDICMQRVFMGPSASATNSNKLNCTANDIRLSRATDVSPSTCIAGETFTLTATFETNVTANARYDAGFFFRIDGGANARGDGNSATGQCSLSWLDPAEGPPALNLDTDSCGDLNAGVFNVTFTIPGVLCQDTDGDGFLNLPNCTSWHSNQGTACTAPPTVNDAHVFDFHPDTKSKCVCDDTFQVPVIVATPDGTVIKKATQAVVTYSVTVVNTSTTTAVTLQALVDDVFGDITKDKNSGNTEVESTTCATGGTIQTGDGVAGGTDTYTCSFAVKFVNDATQNGTDGNHKNTVTATLKGTLGSQTETDVSGSTTINVNLNVGP